jgi:hypothetical protein
VLSPFLACFATAGLVHPCKAQIRPTGSSEKSKHLWFFTENKWYYQMRTCEVQLAREKMLKVVFRCFRPHATKLANQTTQGIPELKGAAEQRKQGWVLESDQAGREQVNESRTDYKQMDCRSRNKARPDLRLGKSNSVASRIDASGLGTQPQ